MAHTLQGFERALLRLRDEAGHGATRLGEVWLQTLQEMLAEGAPETVSDPRALVSRGLTLRPCVGVFENLSARLLHGSAGRGGEEWREAIRRLRLALPQAEQAAANSAALALAGGGERFVTYGCSGTVLRTFAALRAQGRIADVVALESRPRSEGRFLAQKLAEQGHRVRFAPDMQAAALAGPGFLYLTGADALYQDGRAINKSGTLVLAHLARGLGGRTCVVSTTYKLKLGCEVPASEQHPVDDVWPRHRCPLGVEVVNQAVEVLPRELYEELHTELGLTTPQQLAAEFLKWGRPEAWSEPSLG